MRVYYTDNYNDGNTTSHELLAQAVALELGGSSENELERAAMLVESIHPSTEYGKPVIDGFNDFSISHTDRFWAVAISDCPVGLDIQISKPDTNYRLISQRYYTEEEQAVVSADGEEGFFWLWSRREALVKSVGTTIVNSKLPSVMDDDVEFEDTRWYIRSFKLPDAASCELFCAVCVPEEQRLCCEEIVFIHL